jgi:hypothetical protein
MAKATYILYFRKLCWLSKVVLISSQVQTFLDDWISMRSGIVEKATIYKEVPSPRLRCNSTILL